MTCPSSEHGHPAGDLRGDGGLRGLSSGQGRGQDFPLCWSAILAAAASFALPLAFPLPFSSLAKQLQREGCAVAGWYGAERVSAKRTMILTDADLFPPGSVRLNGIKVCGTTLPDAVSRRRLASASGQRPRPAL